MGIVFGIYIIIHGIALIVLDFMAHNVYIPFHGIMSGVIILFNPFASSISIVVLGGIIMMIHSVITFVDTIMIRKDVKEVAKALEENLKEAK